MDKPKTLQQVDKWLIALWMLVNCRHGVSSYEVGRVHTNGLENFWSLLKRSVTGT